MSTLNPTTIPPNAERVTADVERFLETQTIFPGQSLDCFRQGEELRKSIDALYKATLKYLELLPSDIPVHEEMAASLKAQAEKIGRGNKGWIQVFGAFQTRLDKINSVKEKIRTLKGIRDTLPGLKERLNTKTMELIRRAG